MEEDEEVSFLLSPRREDLTKQELSEFLRKNGFPVDQCRVLEGKFLSYYALAVNSMFL